MPYTLITVSGVTYSITMNQADATCVMPLYFWGLFGSINHSMWKHR